jgi:hypothetical protein
MWAWSEEEKKADAETYGGDDDEKHVTASATARNSSRLSAAESAHRLSTSHAALAGSFGDAAPPRGVLDGDGE